MLRSEN